MTTTYDELRQKLIDGDTTVTAAQIDKARRDAEFSALQTEAGEAAQTRQRETERQAQLAELQRRAEVLEAHGLTDLQKHYRTAVESIRALRTGMREFNREAGSVTGQLGRIAALADGITWTVPATLNVEFEQDRLLKEAATDSIPWHSSRLHDAETKAAIAESRGDGAA